MRFGVPGPLWAESSPCECAGAPKLALIGQNVNFNGVSALLAAELAAQLHRQAHILTIVTGDADSGRSRRCTGAVCASQSALLRKVRFLTSRFFAGRSFRRPVPLMCLRCPPGSGASTWAGALESGEYSVCSRCHSARFSQVPGAVSVVTPSAGRPRAHIG